MLVDLKQGFSKMTGKSFISIRTLAIVKTDIQNEL